MRSTPPARALLAAAIALCAVLAGCRVLVAPERPDGTIPLDPPAVYARWWAMTEACAGQGGSFADVAFYEVPGVAVFNIEGYDAIVGYWTAAGNQIVLAGDVILDGGAVRHEMLHAISRQPGHSADLFLGRCAGVVSCGPDCVRDAGPVPEPTGATVSASTLQVGVSVQPAEPRSGVDGGHFSVIVTARNPSTSPVVVALQGVPPRTFLYDVRGVATAAGVTPALTPLAYRFAPGETKQQVYDFAIGSDPANRRIPAGDYTVRGAYGSRSSPTITMTVGP